MSSKRLIKKLTPALILRGYLHSFNEKPTFCAARKIWLFCSENKLDTPQNVLAYFTQGVQKAHDRYEPKQETSDIEAEEKKVREEKEVQAVIRDLVLVRFVRRFKDRCGSKSKAIVRYAEIMGERHGEEVDPETVRKRYNRMLKKYHHYYW